MKPNIDLRVLMTMVFLLLIGATVAVAASPPQVGGRLPDLELAVPSDPDHRAYLGLSKGKSFKIPQIDADVVIIEILNVY